jgi:hypothetical protein
VKKCEPLHVGASANNVGAYGTSVPPYPQGAKVAQYHRARPKSHDTAAQALQFMLELPLCLKPETRADLTDTLSTYAPEPWAYVMLNREQGRAIQAMINQGPRPGVTLGVWMAALSYSAYGTGEIEATRQQLAEVAGTTSGEVSRALSRLEEIGALLRIGRGRYALNPAAAWSGSLAERERAQAETPRLRIVEPA